jgi:hypothetical protein
MPRLSTIRWVAMLVIVSAALLHASEGQAAALPESGWATFCWEDQGDCPNTVHGTDGSTWHFCARTQDFWCNSNYTFCVGIGAEQCHYTDEVIDCNPRDFCWAGYVTEV